MQASIGATLDPSRDKVETWKQNLTQYGEWLVKGGRPLHVNMFPHFFQHDDEFAPTHLI